MRDARRATRQHPLYTYTMYRLHNMVIERDGKTIHPAFDGLMIGNETHTLSLSLSRARSFVASSRQRIPMPPICMRLAAVRDYLRARYLSSHFCSLRMKYGICIFESDRIHEAFCARFNRRDPGGAANNARRKKRNYPAVVKRGGTLPRVASVELALARRAGRLGNT